MLRRDGDPKKLKLIGFLLGAEVQIDEVDIKYLSDKLTDALTSIEGVGRVDVEVLGEMEIEGDSK